MRRKWLIITIFTLVFYISFVGYETTKLTKQLPKPIEKKTNIVEDPLWIYTIKDEQPQHLLVGDSLVANSEHQETEPFITLTLEELNQTLQDKTFQTTTRTSQTMFIEDAFKMLQRDYKKLQLRNYEMITLSLGMNEFISVLTSEPLDINEMAAIKNNFFGTLQIMFDFIHSQNQQTVLILTELYLPEWYEEKENDALVKAYIQEWNNSLAKVASQTPLTIVVPLSTLFSEQNGQYWTSNGTFPNRYGNEMAADWTLNELLSLTVPSYSVQP